MATTIGSQDFLDYAKCPHCPRSTPIQKSNFSLEGEYRSWTKTDGLSEFFLCSGCKQIVGIPVGGLTPRLPTDGLWPVPEDDPLLVYSVSTKCDGEDCEARGMLYVTWNRDRGDEPDAKTSKDWIANDFRCPQGHLFRFPWR
jgi:hypothetical protein